MQIDRFIIKQFKQEPCASCLNGVAYISGWATNKVYTDYKEAQKDLQIILDIAEKQRNYEYDYSVVPLALGVKTKLKEIGYD